MKVLFVLSGNSSDVFVREQAKALTSLGVEIFFFYIQGKGVIGYISSIFRLAQTLHSVQPAIIHAHYGLSGIVASFQKRYSIVTTYHGCDINRIFLRILSILPVLRSNYNVFVSENQRNKVRWLLGDNHAIIPCGIDLEVFSTKQIIDFNNSEIRVLFASDFNTPVKNFPLAHEAINLIDDASLVLVELKGFNRDEVSELLNSCNLLLLTSFREGSPQLIKEAMACNCPIVSTDVGDVRWVIGETEGCYICSYDPADVAEKISKAIHFSKTKGRTNGRQRIIELGLDNESIARRIMSVYDSVLDKRKK